MKRFFSLACCSLYLLPLAVLARPAKPHAAPRATPVTVQMPINSQAVDASGTKYLLTGTLTLTVTPTDVTPPIPPVDAPNLSYLTMNPAAVNGGQPAVVTVVLTKIVPVGMVANVLLTSADASVKVPALLTILAGSDFGKAPVTTLAGVPAERLAAVTATYNGKSASANLRLLADSVTPIPPIPTPIPPIPTPIPPQSGPGPQVMDYLLPDGSPLVGLPAPGSEVRLTGLGFGVTPGRVVWQGDTVPVVAWADTEVRVRMPAYTAQGQWEFALFRADGYWCNMQRPLDKLMPSKVRQ